MNDTTTCLEPVPHAEIDATLAELVAALGDLAAHHRVPMHGFLMDPSFADRVDDEDDDEAAENDDVVDGYPSFMLSLEVVAQRWELCYQWCRGGQLDGAPASVLQAPVGIKVRVLAEGPSLLTVYTEHVARFRLRAIAAIAATRSALAAHAAAGAVAT